MVIDYSSGFYSAASGSHIGSDPAQYIMQYANGQSGAGPVGTGGTEIIYHSPHHSDGPFAGRSIIRFGKMLNPLSLYHALRSTRLHHRIEVRYHLGITSLLRSLAWHR